MHLQTTSRGRRIRPWPGLLLAVALCGAVAVAAPADERARQAFGAGQAAPDGGWTLAQEKVLRLPGTSRERARLPAGTTLRLATTLQVQEAGRLHEVQLWAGQRPGGESDGGFGGEVAVLAVFAAGQAAPIDVAEVKTDRFTGFPSAPLLKLTAADDAFVLHNTHHNAGQPYTAASLFHLRQGRLRRIAEVDLLGELSGCAKAFDESLEWLTEPDMATLPIVVARVTLVHAPRASTGGCEGRRPAERREVFEGRWRWDSAKGQYRDQGGTLERLDRWNDSRR